jgi:hypothetical protein
VAGRPAHPRVAGQRRGKACPSRGIRERRAACRGSAARPPGERHRRRTRPVRRRPTWPPAGHPHEACASHRSGAPRPAGPCTGPRGSVRARENARTRPARCRSDRRRRRRSHRAVRRRDRWTFGGRTRVAGRRVRTGVRDGERRAARHVLPLPCRKVVGGQDPVTARQRGTGARQRAAGQGAGDEPEQRTGRPAHAVGDRAGRLARRFHGLPAPVASTMRRDPAATRRSSLAARCSARRTSAGVPAEVDGPADSGDPGVPADGPAVTGAGRLSPASAGRGTAAVPASLEGRAPARISALTSPVESSDAWAWPQKSRPSVRTAPRKSRTRSIREPDTARRSARGTAAVFSAAAVTVEGLSLGRRQPGSRRCSHEAPRATQVPCYR